MVWDGISRGGRTDLLIVMRAMRSWTSTSTLVQSDPSLSKWTKTLDLIVPGWVRTTSSRRPSSVWIGQHARLIASRSSMFGTCYRWRFRDVRSNQQLSWNWKMSSLKSGTILRWQPPRTHWKHETTLPGCDCFPWFTHKLMAGVAAGNWDSSMT